MKYPKSEPVLDGRAVTGARELRDPRSRETPAEPMGYPVSETRPKVANFQVRRPDTSQFDTVEGLSAMAGVGPHALRRLIVKEVVDNALDEMDSPDEEDRGSGLVTVDRNGDTYIVTDEGGGFPQDDKLCDLFWAYRDMVTTKFLRKPSRGVLGNGLRVLAAAVALSEGTITVESHGQRTTLQPRRMGLPTEVISQTASRRKRGTRITFTLDAAIIPSDEDDLMHAEAAIALADHSEPPYKRDPSPHWLDLDHLVQGFHFIEPHDMTVRQWIERLDGCSGAKAGHIASLFGKNRTCSSMREAEIAALLGEMQKSARVVNPKALGPIGANAFGPDYDGYKIAEAWLPDIGAHRPLARIPVLIEAWANVTSRQRGEARLDIYCNRTLMVGHVEARRGHDRIWISGAELRDAIMVAGGDCDLVVAITSPHIPTVSNGKVPDLSRLREEIVEALRKAFTQSRNRLSPDPAQPKPPKGEPPPKAPKPEPYQVSGPLAIMLAKEAERAGLSPRDLLVLSPGHDPFHESKTIRREAEWFRDQVKLLKPEGEVHSRGMYYRCLAAKILLPDGTEFEGSKKNADLIDTACKYARYLGLVPFERIVDERSAPHEPYTRYDEEHDDASPDPIRRELLVSDGREPDKRGPLAVPELDLLLPTLSISAPEVPRQRFRIVMLAEKVSLGEVLRPIAEEVHGELLLGTGEFSEARVFEICRRAAKDRRPLRILYFSDFDPSGWQMNVSVSRKLQAQINLQFRDLDVRLIRVALTIEQVIEYDLPDSPLQEGEKRKSKWFQKWGREQVEIDALAALRPDVLDQIARNAVAPYFDPTFEGRYAEAVEMSQQRLNWFLDQPAYGKAKALIEKAHKSAVRALAALNAAQAAALDTMRHVVDTEAPDLPRVVVKPKLRDEPEAAIFDSRDDFVTATLMLKDFKALSPEDDRRTGNSD
jgi:hypothetical protein